jgi:succinate-acetate transporter protein
MTTPETNVGNPGPSGLVAFGLTTMLLSLINAGVLPAGGEPVVIPLALSFGGVNQLIAGILEFRAGNTFGMTAFLSYGAFWLWFAMLFLFGHRGTLDLSAAGPTMGVALLLWGVLSGGFWISTFRINLVLWLTFLGVVLVFFMLGFASLLHMPALDQLAGWVGILTGFLAAYCGIAQLSNGTFSRTILPLGAALVQ